MPATQDEFEDMMQALIQGEVIPETVSKRLVVDYYDDGNF